MCIAIYSLQGNKIPKEEYLKNSFIANSDGAGFAFNTDDHKVKIVKGLMTWDAFINTFRKYEKKYGFKDRGVLIHFRITTHGGTNPECTHPFPIVADEGIMHKLEYISDYACIHNGIIQLTSTEAYSRNKMSDTMVFVEKYLTKIATNKRWFKNDTNFELIYDLLDSKMAILNGYGEIKSTYGFTKDEDGNYYSNTSYKEQRIKRIDWSWYGDYSDYYDGYEEPIPVMKLEKNNILVLENFEDVEYDEAIDYFIGEDGDCYMREKIKRYNGEYVDAPKYLFSNIMYIGQGVMFDKNYNIKPFKKTNELYFESCDYNWFSEEDKNSSKKSNKKKNKSKNKKEGK